MTGLSRRKIKRQAEFMSYGRKKSGVFIFVFVFPRVTLLFLFQGLHMLIIIKKSLYEQATTY